MAVVRFAEDRNHGQNAMDTPAASPNGGWSKHRAHAGPCRGIGIKQNKNRCVYPNVVERGCEEVERTFPGCVCACVEELGAPKNPPAKAKGHRKGKEKQKRGNPCS